MAQRRAIRWESFVAILSAANALSEGSLVVSSADLLYAIAGLSSAILASNQSGFCLSLAKGVYSWVIDGLTDVIPSLVGAPCRADPQNISDGVGKVLTQVWHWCPGSIYTGPSLLLGAVDSFGLEVHLAANQGAVGVAVITVVTACCEDKVKQGSSL